MDPTRFDALARSLAAPKSRRGLFGGLAALVVGVRVASAQSCPPGQTANRKGDCSCPPGTDACPDGCFDKTRDPNNCGGCGRSCAGGECRKGECRCPDGRRPSAVFGCGDPPTTSTTTTTTAPSPVALGGSCTTPAQCASGACCGGRCVDLLDDDGHCGACGQACPNLCAQGAACTDEACAAGQCCCIGCYQGACYQFQGGPAAACGPDVPCYLSFDTCGADGHCCRIDGEFCFGDADCCSGTCAGGSCA